MSPFLYEIIVYMLEALISGIFLMNLLKEKYNRVLHIIFWLEIVFVAMLVTPAFSIFRIIVIAFAELLFTLYMFEDSVKKRVSLFFLKEVLLLMASGCSYLLYLILIDKHTEFFAICKSDDCTYCLLYLLLFSVFISIALQFTKERKGAEFFWVTGTQLIIGGGEASAILAVSYESGGIVSSGESYLIIISTLCMVAANVSIGMLAPYLLRKITMSVSINYGKELSSMEYKYYETSVENEKKIQQMKHDISNHIQTIYALFSNGDTQRGFALIDDLNSHYSHIEQMVYCSNPVINIILSNKKNEAEEKNIETHIRVKQDLENIPISDFDLSTVICNLLDNAIQGCISSNQSHPRLIVELLAKNQHLVVRVLNTCSADMNVDSTNRIETTKSDRVAHGLGMPIISGIAKKYRGDFIVSAENGLFTATVVLSLRENKNKL